MERLHQVAAEQAQRLTEARSEIEIAFAQWLEFAIANYRYFKEDA
jgi:hypothetical protein